MISDFTIKKDNAVITVDFNKNLEPQLNNLIGEGEKLQTIMIDEITKSIDSYIPFLSGDLVRSKKIINNKTSITWDSKYAKYIYYKGRSNGLRGRLWIQRWKGDNLESLLNKVNNELR